MLSTKKILVIFIPAIALVSFALFFRILQYEPLFPDLEETENQDEGAFVIPIFPTDPILGDKKAPITIIAFEDFACTACKDQSMMLDILREKNPGTFKIIWKGLPVKEYPYNSQTAHIYGLCALKQQKFNEFSQLAFANSDNLSDTILQNIAQSLDLNMNKFSDCLESNEPVSVIANTEAIAQILNIQAVPTFFMDNRQLVTPKTIDEWETILTL